MLCEGAGGAGEPRVERPPAACGSHVGGQSGQRPPAPARTGPHSIVWVAPAQLHRGRSSGGPAARRGRLGKAAAQAYAGGDGHRRRPRVPTRLLVLRGSLGSAPANPPAAPSGPGRRLEPTAPAAPCTMAAPARSASSTAARIVAAGRGRLGWLGRAGRVGARRESGGLFAASAAAGVERCRPCPPLPRSRRSACSHKSRVGAVRSGRLSSKRRRGRGPARSSTAVNETAIEGFTRSQVR